MCNDSVKSGSFRLLLPHAFFCWLFGDVNIFTEQAIHISWAVCYCWRRPGNSHFKLRSQWSACVALTNTLFYLDVYGTTRSNRCCITVGLLSRCTNSCGIDAAPSDSTATQISLSFCSSLLLLFFHFGCCYILFVLGVLLHELIADCVSPSWFYLALQPVLTGLMWRS